MRVAIFYRVSENNTRDRFDGMKGRDIINTLDRECGDDETNAHIYCLDGENTEQMPDLRDFEQDFNDEILDGGWWCVITEY